MWPADNGCADGTPLSRTPISVAYIQGAAKDGEPAPTLAWLHAHPTGPGSAVTVVGTHPQIVGNDVVYRLTEDARSIAFERACERAGVDADVKTGIARMRQPKHRP